MDRAKPYNIPKREVWEAYKKVRANHGAAGVDGQTISDFEVDLGNNLFKLWNRLSSGSYFPPPVRRVDIPKGDGKTRPLGIPTVADRIAQMVVKRHLEPLVEPQFHPDSYGYRPGKSALDAVGMARQRCWRRDWVLDLDIKAFFDSIDTELLMRAVRKHTDCPWALLYIDRWLKAPMQMADGSIIGRERGTPQGEVISPLLALQLQFSRGSESMGNHDSGPDDWWRFDRGYAVAVGSVIAGGQAAYSTVVHAGSCCELGWPVSRRVAEPGAAQDRLDAGRGRRRPRTVATAGFARSWALEC